MVTTWIDGRRCGKAVCTWANGDKWEMDYEDDKIKGALQGWLSSGDSFEGHVKEVLVVCDLKASRDSKPTTVLPGQAGDSTATTGGSKSMDSSWRRQHFQSSPAGTW